MPLKSFAEQDIFCLIEINNGQSLSCHNYYSANLIEIKYSLCHF